MFFGSEILETSKHFDTLCHVFRAVIFITDFYGSVIIPVGLAYPKAIHSTNKLFLTCPRNCFGLCQ
jgi:hypothetical protein